jgi:hypothetical protein
MNQSKASLLIHRDVRRSTSILDFASRRKYKHGVFAGIKMLPFLLLASTFFQVKKSHVWSIRRIGYPFAVQKGPFSLKISSHGSCFGFWFLLKVVLI